MGTRVPHLGCHEGAEVGQQLLHAWVGPNAHAVLLQQTHILGSNGGGYLHAHNTRQEWAGDGGTVDGDLAEAAFFSVIIPTLFGKSEVPKQGWLEG